MREQHRLRAGRVASYHRLRNTPRQTRAIPNQVLSKARLPYQPLTLLVERLRTTSVLSSASRDNKWDTERVKPDPITRATLVTPNHPMPPLAVEQYFLSRLHPKDGPRNITRPLQSFGNARGTTREEAFPTAAPLLTQTASASRTAHRLRPARLTDNIHAKIG